MAGKTKNYKGWQLVETIHGWYAVKGTERIRVGNSYEEHTEALDRRYRKAIDEREA